MAAVASVRRVRLRSAAGVELTLAGCVVAESYSTGWSATAVVSATRTDVPFTAETMLGVMYAHGVQAGLAAVLELFFEGGLYDGIVIRCWPCVITAVLPEQTAEFTALAQIRLVDPISCHARNPIYGAYRGASPAELVGGALSLAVGGDGKPTQEVRIAGFPPVLVQAGYRDSISVIPYAVATGEPLGVWLAHVLGSLGLRAELEGMLHDQSVLLSLRDTRPTASPRTMTIVEDDAAGASGDESDYGPILLRGHAAFPGMGLRAGLLDDPTQGGARPLASLGSVGHVFSETELDAHEATDRLYREIAGRYTEMLMVRAASRQPMLQPGAVVQLSREVHGADVWQVASVVHSLRGEIYDNDVTLLQASVGWYPPLPSSRPARFVTAMVNGGDRFEAFEPVARDRLGRVKVMFSFNPSPVGLEALQLEVADRDGDSRVTLSDFTEEEVAAFTDEEAEQQAVLDSLFAGDLADPFPGRADDELTAEELARREALRADRDKAFLFLAYKKAKEADAADLDRDGVVSDRDALISAELGEALADPESRTALEQQWAQARTDAEAAAEADTDLPEVDPLVAEYGRFFDPGAELDPSEDAAAIAARRDAEIEPDRWPPRIPLPVLEAAAGALHGFVGAHRHGDLVRVAVHNPFSAEIVGSQYRDDRRVNPELQGAVAGLVAEHNFSDQWTGIVFRHIDDLERDVVDNFSSDSGEEADDSSSDETPE